MEIDRCYCFQKTFAEIRQSADASGATTIKEAQAAIEFGHNCQLCHPYVREMLRSGTTVFREIIEEESIE